MDAVTLYLSTCRYVIKSNPHDYETWADLYRYLPFLRQALSCCVCGKVIQDPMGPPDTVCKHHVCKDCIGGRMRLKPQCGWCKEHDQFIEKPQLTILVQCFKKLCEYIASTPIASILADSVDNGGTNSLLTIIDEGMSIPLMQETNDRASNPLPLVPQLFSTPPKLTRMVDLKKTKSKEDTGTEKSKSHTQSAASHTTASSSKHEVKSAGCHMNSPDLAKDTKTVNSDSVKIETPDSTSQNQEPHYSVTLTNHETPRLKLKRKYPLDDHASMVKKLHPEETDVTQTKRKKGSKYKNSQDKKKGCRCGNATPSPGKLTCYGQRCPCYVARLACIECRCKGCRNPKKEIKIEPESQLKSSSSDNEDVEINVV